MQTPIPAAIANAPWSALAHAWNESRRRQAEEAATIAALLAEIDSCLDPIRDDKPSGYFQALAKNPDRL